MPNYTTRVSARRNSAGDYVVKLYQDGVHIAHADYFTPNREDAHSTAKAMVEARIQGDREIAANPGFYVLTR